MKKTKLLTTLGAVALIGAIGVGSTFAYLTAETGVVKNTFTVGKVQFDTSMGAGLTESEVARDTDGKYQKDVDGPNNWKKTEQEYTKLVAGEELLKDPTVHIAADSEDCWVFAKIENANEDLSIEYNVNEWEDVTDAYKTANQIDDKTDFVVYATKNIIPTSKTVTHSTIFNSVKVSKDLASGTEFTPIKISACAVSAARASISSFTSCRPKRCNSYRNDCRRQYHYA